MKNQNELSEIANSLSNDDLATLIQMTSNRMDVYIGKVGSRMISSEIESVSLNGPCIQINLELAELDTILDDEFIAGGFAEAG